VIYNRYGESCQEIYVATGNYCPFCAGRVIRKIAPPPGEL
jgi:hypothetical protein